MNELAQLHCSPIAANTPRLSQREINELEAKLPGWRTYEKDAEMHLEKFFRFENFSEAIAFTY